MGQGRSRLKQNIKWALLLTKTPLELSEHFKKHVTSIVEDEDLNDVLVMDDSCVIYRTEHGWLADSDRNDLMAGRTARALYFRQPHEAWNVERQHKRPLWE